MRILSANSDLVGPQSKWSLKMRSALTILVFVSSVLSHVVSAHAADLCENLRAQLGNDVGTRCSLNAFTLKTSSGTMVGVDCDDPSGNGREITAGASPAKLLASLDTIKLQALFHGERQSSPIAILKATNQAPLGSVQPLAARRLCEPGERALSCDNLSDKYEALDVLNKSTQGLYPASYDEIKTGRYHGKILRGIFITFGLRLSDLTACRHQ